MLKAKINRTILARFDSTPLAVVMAYSLLEIESINRLVRNLHADPPSTYNSRTARAVLIRSVLRLHLYTKESIMASVRAPFSNPFTEEYNPFSDLKIITTVTSEMAPVERKGSANRSFFDGFKFQKGTEGLQPKTEDLDPRSKSNVKEKRISPIRAYSINETTPLEQEPKRSLSSAFADAIFRRGSDHSNKSRATSPQRKLSEAPSVPSIRKGSFFQSSNPDVDSQIPRKLSTASAKSSEHGPSRNNSVAMPTERRPSYVPRNATSSFLNSTTLKTADERAKLQEDVSAAGARRASLATDVGETVGRVSGTGMPTGRRPSGMVPDNVAAKYMRSASGSGEVGRPAGRTNSAEGRVTAVYMAPDQHQIWQHAVARSQNRPSFSKPDTSDRSGPGRMPSISDIREEASPSEELPAPEVKVHAPSPAKVRKQFSIDTFKANDEKSKNDSSRVDSAKMLEDQISPRAVNFDQSISGRYHGGESESPLESLGFRGAVAI